MNCSKHVDRAFARICTRCELPLCEECVVERNARPFCATCADRVESSSPHQPPPIDHGRLVDERDLAASDDIYSESHGNAVAPKVNPGSFARGIGFAFVAGVLGALLWYGSAVITGYELGIVAVGVGWLVGYAAAMGAGQGSFELSMISVAIAIVCMLTGEYLIASHFYREMLGDAVTGGLPLGVFFGEYLASAGLLAMVFWAIGAYEAYKLSSEY